MKGFPIYVKNDLLEPKHYLAMEESIWLYLWFLDKMTNIQDNIGRVLGGKPIVFDEVEADLGISRRNYVRWVDRLRAHGYINTLRTPRGLVIEVNKAVKPFKKKVMRQKRYSDAPKVGGVMRQIGTSNIRPIQDIYKDSEFKILSKEEALKRLRPKNESFAAEKK